MRPRLFIGTITIVIAIVAAGTTWELLALEVFAKRAGSLKGMIANPRPYDYVNYDYTPNGHYYLRWAFVAPFSVTGGLLLITGIISSIALSRAKLRKHAVVVWLLIATLGFVFLVVTTYKYLLATKFFI